MTKSLVFTLWNTSWIIFSHLKLIEVHFLTLFWLLSRWISPNAQKWPPQGPYPPRQIRKFWVNGSKFWNSVESTFESIFTSLSMYLDTRDQLQTPDSEPKKCQACYLCLFEFVLFYLNLVWRNIHHQMGSYEKWPSTFFCCSFGGLNGSFLSRSVLRSPKKFRLPCLGRNRIFSTYSPLLLEQVFQPAWELYASKKEQFFNLWISYQQKRIIVHHMNSKYYNV